MCIVLASTAHPSFALILLSNRDEFVLRPTTRPHWWSAGATDPSLHPHNKYSPTTNCSASDNASGTEILSSRDAARKECGTWLGISRSGRLAALTNVREPLHAENATRGVVSRGAIATMCLSMPPKSSIEEFVKTLLAEDHSNAAIGALQNVGGFSLLCGTLRLKRTETGSKSLEPLYIFSNRATLQADLPSVAGSRGETFGLSNTIYGDPIQWPKVELGTQLLREVINSDVSSASMNASKSSKAQGNSDLISRLFGILDTNTMPARQPNEKLSDYLYHLRQSIFIPEIGILDAATGSKLMSSTERQALNHGQGPYATMRQTVILVDWDGNVRHVERALWDEAGLPVVRGSTDSDFSFRIEGWEPWSSNVTKEIKKDIAC
jgi:uncharacterized protein with NRDE domain